MASFLRTEMARDLPSFISKTPCDAGSGGAHVLIDPDDNNIVWNADDIRWEISFDVTGFSGFFVHATKNGGALPIGLLSFTATKLLTKVIA